MSKARRMPGNKMQQNIGEWARKVVSRGGKDLSERSTWKIGLLAGLLIVVCVVVLAAHWPSLSAQAMMLDDDQYLVENRLVQNPSWSSAKRFLTEVFEPSTVRGYYQPITMISLMLDVTMGGGVDNLKPFHYTSLCLHIANSLLVIVFLYLLFGQVWPAAMVGLLYGVHPTTIESIAWVSERKTLLAAFFALWCLIFYVRYVRRQSWRYYAICLVAYVLSLLSKPTIVAMPVLLLLLDWWPFHRLSKRVVFEKLPLFIIGGVAVVVTFISQSRTSLVKLPGGSGMVRVLLIFCHNIIFYLYNIVWPANLSWYYPFPKPFNLSQPMVLFGVIGTCVLIVVLLISLRWSRCLVMGWLFFFAAIFPTLGIIRFHPMIAADRHTYFPMIGLLLAVGWLLSRFWGGEGEFVKLGRPVRRIILLSAVVILMVSEFILTQCYLVYWRDTERVYRYMLTLSPDVAILHNNLGNVLKGSGKIDEALKHFGRSLKLAPNSAEIHNNVGNVLCELGKIDEAIEHYEKALSLKTNFSEAHYNLATVLLEQGKLDEAITELRESLRLDPENADALSSLGFALAQQGNFDEAVKYYRKAIEMEPDNVITCGRLGLALSGQGKIDEAIEKFLIVLRERPEDAEMQCNVAILLERQGKTNQAVQHYLLAVQSDPNHFGAHNNLAIVLHRQGKVDEAIPHFRHAIRLKPDYVGAHKNLGIALTFQGKLDEAITHFRKVLQYRPGDANVRYNLAVVLMSKGLSDEAISEFREALRINPNHKQAQRALEAALAEQKKR